MTEKFTKTHAKRLLNVVRALREAEHPERFYMGQFLWDETPDVDEAPELGIKEKHLNENWCGTPACALGHYGARRDLQRAFVIERDNWGPLLQTTIGDPDELFAGAARHFGISESEVLELFDFDGCGEAKTTKGAARYIERFVKRKAKEAGLKL